MAPVAAPGLVAVTGANGFMASHVCAELLTAGYRVRAIVRNPSDEDKVGHLKKLPGAERLSFGSGDLLLPGSYDEALQGVDAVIHAAAVVEINATADPHSTIVKPSVDGVKNVLSSADKAGTVKRFVQTSSVIATLSHTSDPSTTFSEKDWNTASTVENGDAYGFGKTLAEREAHEHKGNGYDVVALNPGVMLGPCMTKAHTKASVVVLRQMLYGNAQPVYKQSFVDVRDVAQAHVRALRDLATPADATPQRYLLCSDSQMFVSDLEAPLRELFPEYQIDCINSIGAVGKALLSIPLLWRVLTSEFQRGMYYANFSFDNTKSKSELGVSYRPLNDTLRDSVTSMVEPGFIKPRVKK